MHNSPRVGRIEVECSWCAELILAKARICRFCQREQVRGALPIVSPNWIAQIEALAASSGCEPTSERSTQREIRHARSGVDIPEHSTETFAPSVDASTLEIPDTANAGNGASRSNPSTFGTLGYAKRPRLDELASGGASLLSMPPKKGEDGLETATYQTKVSSFRRDFLGKVLSSPSQRETTAPRVNKTPSNAAQIAVNVVGQTLIAAGVLGIAYVCVSNVSAWMDDGSAPFRKGPLIFYFLAALFTGDSNSFFAVFVSVVAIWIGVVQCQYSRNNPDIQ